jgi:MerR family transcriptional regulator, copper efflux regulator
MRIGQVAAEAGVSVQAVRHYERRGLLPQPARRPSGYREYPSSAVRRLRAIKWAQSLGFRLGQMSDLLSIGQSHLRGRRTRVRALVRTKLSELDDALHELKSMRSALLAVAACQCDGDCPILEKALATPAAADVRRSSRRPR